MLSSANRRLAAQWAQLRRVNTFKNELLGTLAHDLRNPLTVIVGRADLLMSMLDRGPLVADQVQAQIDQIRAAANRLDEMVASLLSDARADALDITIRPDETDLSALIHEVAEANQPLAARKQQSIIVTAPPVCPFLCDGDRMREAIDNLLSNAIKYSQIGGRIDLALECQHKNAVIRVQDQGAGLSPEDLSRVFGRFQRLSAKPTGDEISTGLGLSIVKRIVDLHGGSVVAESPGPGLGTIFTVTLPVQASAPTQKAIDIPAIVMR
jgi:signal transduction histidine kinase